MQKESRLLKIGVLGAGPVSQCAHFAAVRKAYNAELYAICDKAEDLESVIIATADPFHVPLCRKAIAAGKHILVEKPLGVGVEECRQLQQQLQGSGLVFQVGNNRRFDPGIAFARQFIRQELGEMIAFKARC